MDHSILLTCVKCHNYFDVEERAPHLLPCLHSCCLLCMKTVTSKGTTIYCQECNETFAVENTQTLPFDSTRKNLAAIQRLQTEHSEVHCDECSSNATGRCTECEEFLCSDCTEAHSKTKLTKHHQVISLTTLTSSSTNGMYKNFTCDVQGHEGQKVLFFCDSKNCRKPVCTICMLRNHSQEQGHDVRNMGDVYGDSKRQLEGHLVDMKYTRTKTDETLRNLESRRKELYDRSKTVEEELDTYFNMCMQSLEKRRNELKEMLQSSRDIGDIRIEQQVDNIKKQRRHLDHTYRAGQERMSYSSQPEFISVYNTIVSRIKQLEERCEQVKVFDSPVDVKFIPKYMEDFAAKVKRIGDVWVSSDEFDTSKLTIKTLDKEIKCSFGKPRSRTITVNTESSFNVTNGTDERLALSDEELMPGKIACPEFCFDTTTTHIQNTVSQNKKSLTNQKPRRHLVRSLNHAFINYRGTVATQPLGKLAQYYFEVQVHLFIKRQLRQDLIFEIGLSRKSSIDKNYTIDCHPHSWVVCARKCNVCRSVCLMAWHNNMKLCHQPIADICPPGTTHKAVYGFLLDTRFKQWVVIDARNKRYLFRFRNVDVSRPLWPTFGVYNPDLVDVTLTLRSGTDIKTIFEIPFDS